MFEHMSDCWIIFNFDRIDQSVVTSVVEQWKSISKWCITTDLHSMAMLLLTKLVLLDSKVRVSDIH